MTEFKETIKTTQKRKKIELIVDKHSNESYRKHNFK